MVCTRGAGAAGIDGAEVCGAVLPLQVQLAPGNQGIAESLEKGRENILVASQGMNYGSIPI